MKHKYCFPLLIPSLVLLMVMLQNNSFAQARLVLGDGGAPSPIYMHISGGAFLVIGDATASAAPNTITRNAGWIISGDNGASPVGAGTAGQNNRIKWYIGSATGTYVVPWGWSTTDYVPLTFTIGTAGAPAVAPYFTFSTYRLTSCTNSAAGNLPTLGANPPTNYNSPNQPGDASIRGVDRFWMIDASGYTTNPDLSSLSFTYVNGATSEIGTISCSNTISAANLGAQRWNTTNNSWDGIAYPPKGTVSTNTVTLANADVTTSDLTYRWWTLVDKSYPLPVEFINLSAECNHGDVTVKWSTATEQNSNYFTVERSFDGTNFSAIATVTAAGNSSTLKNYSAVDNDAYSGTSFYRISETDFNGSTMYSSTITVNGCSGDDVVIYGTGGGVSININAIADGEYNIELYDVLGQKLISQVSGVAAGNNHIKLSPSAISSAIYIVKVYNSSNAVAKKVFIRSDNSQ